MASILPAHGTCEKTGRFFFFHPVLNKNLFDFFKIHLCLPRNTFEKRMVKNVAKAVFWEKVVILDPPEVVSGSRGKRGCWLVELPCVQEWF
jgi:hypothetical protein